MSEGAKVHDQKVLVRYHSDMDARVRGCDDAAAAAVEIAWYFVLFLGQFLFITP